LSVPAAPGSLWLQPLTPRGGPPRGAPPPVLRRVIVEAARMVKPELKGRPGSEIWGLKLAEVGDRTAAEALAGQTLLLAVCDRERLRSADEFYIQDLVGLKVGGVQSPAGAGRGFFCSSSAQARWVGAAVEGFCPARLQVFHQATGSLLGLVTEVYEGTGTFSTLRVRLAPSRADVAESVMRTTLLPFAAEMVPIVDVPAGRMEVGHGGAEGRGGGAWLLWGACIRAQVFRRGLFLSPRCLTW
jgi:ribosomal 30S subunit maturation factor RimM